MNLSCDLKKAVKVSYLDGFIGRGDSFPISVTVTDDGQPASISGDVSAVIIRPNGTTVTTTGGTISGNVVSITIPVFRLNVAGRVSITIRLTTGDVETTLAVLVANVLF